MNLRSNEERVRLLPLDLTSMVDLVFLLLIFFLTTSTFIEKSRARVELPEEVGEALQKITTSSVVINITRNGTIVVGGEYLSVDQVIAMLSADIKAAGGDPSAIDLLIRADRAAPLEHLNQLAERLIDLNVRRWNLATVIPYGSLGPGEPS